MPTNLPGNLLYAARSLSRTPGFAAAVVLTMALGIGVNVASFSLFQQILLSPLPVAEPERLVNLSSPGPKLDPERDIGGAIDSVSGDVDTVFSYPMFRDLERVQEPFAGIAAYRIVFDANLSTGEQAQQDSAMFVSGSYFPLLGLRPAIGRLLGPDDDRIDGEAEAVVLSHAYWQEAFGGDPAAVGRSLIVNGKPLVIVGVAPPGFHGTTIGARPSVFVPITFRGPNTFIRIPTHDNRGFHWLHLFARLKPGVTLEQASAAINPAYRAILNDVELPLQEVDTEPQVLEALRTKPLVLESGARGQSAVVVAAGERLDLLLVTSFAVLLLCCANVAGLMLVRASSRRGEMAVRASMGASRSRLATLLLTESLLLALPAALLSLPFASLTLETIASRVPDLNAGNLDTVAPGALFDVDLSVAAALVAVVTAILSAVIASLLPLRDLLRIDPGKTLRSAGARQTSGPAITRFRTILATVQIAVSMALLAITGVFAQNLVNISRIDLGLDVDSVVTFSISPESSGYTRADAAGLVDRIEDALANLPGIRSVATSQFPILTGNGPGVLVRRVAGMPVDETVGWNVVSPGFFSTLGVELLAGREFTDSDEASSRGIVIVNRRFAEHFGIDNDVIGSNLGFTTRGDVVEIIGLTADAKYGNLTDEIGPQVFQFGTRSGALYVRGDLSADSLLQTVRETVGRIDPVVPIIGLRTLEEQLGENFATERFVAGAAATFAVLATALAAIGLYAVLAYIVAQRAGELALRIALGATASRIGANVLGRVATMAAAGIALGIVIAAWLGRAARGLLFELDGASPAALAGAAGALVIVTLVAAYLPVRRASRVDPMLALRHE